jgi:hypothetical protein
MRDKPTNAKAETTTIVSQTFPNNSAKKNEKTFSAIKVFYLGALTN